MADTFEIQTFPELPAHTQTVELDGQEYRLRLIWRERQASWYMSLFTVTGTPIVLGRRLSPESTPTYNLSIPDAPPGLFVVRGDSKYDRMDLGDDLALVYIPVEFVEAAEDDETIEVRV